MVNQAGRTETGSFVIRTLYLGGLFILGVTLATLLWDTIRLPFHNPYGIVGPQSLAQINPNDDIVRFIVFVATPSLLLLLTYGPVSRIFSLTRKNSRVTNLQKAKRLPFLALLFCTLFSLTIPTFHASGEFDSYHEGESIGVAISYMEGKVPYKEISFSHGLFLDPLRSVWAMELFGQSIGASRAFMSLVKILSFVLFGLLVHLLYRGNCRWTLLTLLGMFIVLPAETFTILPREFVSFFYLALLFFIASKWEGRGKSQGVAAMSFTLAFIPLFTFLISVDRAFFLTALYVFAAPVLCCFFLETKGERARFTLSALLGILAAISSVWLGMQGGFMEFISFIFQHIPKTKELSDGISYSLDSSLHFNALLLFSGIGYWLTTQLIFCLTSEKRYMPALGSFFRRYFPVLLLFLIAIFCFRSGLGRSDDEHIRNNLVFPILTCFYIAIAYYLSHYTSKKLVTYLSTITVALTCLAMIILSVTIYDDKLLAENFPIHTPDELFIPPEYQRTISFLQDNLQEEESFITLTSEASWYYFVGKASPIRFPIVHFGIAQVFQQEIIENMKQQNIRYILYKNENWTNTIDAIPNERRLPLLYAYIHTNYAPYLTLDGNEIWQRNHP